ncbi:glutamate receptor ionotropic, kainate 4-like [Sinocyclocheilus rhinocerous]|uniref:glutamate receptor ionotropic, kainate 4-like n=1 Tax=Sinocyclocheilus rhinocerous TaxID=307959 RepID=UPI0007B8338B|nr:PREDICTED: glutamate receptor ionotropic, kainate 4-like [Sinocyclocheilus rhinocerous]
MLAAWALLLFLAMWVRNATSGPLSFRIAAILDDPMECSRGERLAITLAKDSINRSSNRSTTGKLEVDIFELLRDSEYETGETMCQIMSKGVVAVLGPSASPASNSIISNICGEKEYRAWQMREAGAFEIFRSHYSRAARLRLRLRPLNLNDTQVQEREKIWELGEGERPDLKPKRTTDRTSCGA